MAVFIPASINALGVSKLLFLSSTFVLEPNVGPIKHGFPAALSSSTMRCPSVQWSKVISKSNSLAILSAVKISSALWACAFKGISFFSTGSIE